METPKAVRLATKLNEDDPEWNYIIKSDGIHAQIEVYDENDIYLGELTGTDNDIKQVTISKIIGQQ